MMFEIRLPLIKENVLRKSNTQAWYLKFLDKFNFHKFIISYCLRYLELT